ncbi:hypothetical protein B7R22_16620 [Subtercola boreus]|uniref:Uncharacterized protein n=2 Tax=Subtercola boreus TaxID=120213 RepID=A0A3E0VRC2_9MICO|nr:hypothetical protein B7R22_16620 [Subtercola boreus]
MLKSPIGLPAGERTETAIDVSEGVEFLGRIQTTIDQLDECLELSRELNSGTFIPSSYQTDSSALETSFSTSTDGTDAGHPNRSWAVLAPAAIQAGYCALRATGWFDDRASGIDIFGEDAFLDRLEPLLRAALAN